MKCSGDEYTTNIIPVIRKSVFKYLHNFLKHMCVCVCENNQFTDISDKSLCVGAIYLTRMTM